MKSPNDGIQPHDDMYSEEFTAECRRQTELAARLDATDADLLIFMDDALSDIENWTA